VNIDYDANAIGCGAIVDFAACGFSSAARCSDGEGRRFGLCSFHLLVRNSGLDRDPLPGDALVAHRKATLWAREADQPLSQDLSASASYAIGEVQPGTLALVLHVDSRHWFYMMAGSRIGWLAPDAPSQVIKGEVT